MAQLVDMPDDVGRLFSEFMERGWCDGLPVVPPTKERVSAILAKGPIGRDESVGRMPPNYAESTGSLIAINAVMAGCEPAYFPAVVAAVEAVVDLEYNLAGVQATTNGASPLIAINGPWGKHAGFNAAGNVMGPGWRPNATVGRALRLCLINIGGGTPGVRDLATLGQPAKFGLCIRENEEESPWAPYHVDQAGYSGDDDTVTVFSITGTQSIFDGTSKTAPELLKTLVSSTANVGMHNVQMGGGPVVLLCVDHARLFADAGYTKPDFRKLLFDQCRVPIDRIPSDMYRYMVQNRRPNHVWEGQSSVPIADAPDDIKVFVVGGPGPHSMLLPRSSIGLRASITKRIRTVGEGTR